MPIGASIWGPAAATLIGGYLANKSSQTQTTTTKPTVDPAYGPLQQMILRQAMARLSKPVDMGGYTASGLAQNNAAFAGAKSNLANSLTARGLGGSPVAGAGAATLETGRAATGSQFLNSIPLVQNQLEGQALSSAADVLRTGTGQTTTGDATQTGGGGAAGAATNLAAYLGYLQGSGKFPGAQKTAAPAYQLPGYGTALPNVGGY